MSEAEVTERYGDSNEVNYELIEQDSHKFALSTALTMREKTKADILKIIYNRLLTLKSIEFDKRKRKPRKWEITYITYGISELLEIQKAVEAL
jgi:hypothetical protein